MQDMKNIIGKKLLFTSNAATIFFKTVLSNWPSLIKNRTTIVFLPCSSLKPIQNSPTHCFLSPITRYFDENILKVIVSEPLTLIPYEYEEYPNYDYPPKNLMNNSSEYEIFIERLKTFKKITPEKIKCYYIGGKHHYNIIYKAGWNISKNFIPLSGIIDYNKTAKKLHKILYQRKLRKIQFTLQKITKKNIIIKQHFLK